MKKTSLLMCSVLTALLLASCGNTSKMDSLIETNNKQTETASAEKDADKVSLDPKVTGDSINLLSDPENKKTKDKSAADTESGEYDVDLTVLDGTMLYAKVLEMVNNPEDYNGKTVRAAGPFSYFKNPDTQNEYFAVLIADITACCAQGIEFRLDGDYSYPEDYPDAETEIIISGVCDIYKEGTATYMQLLHAKYEVNE